MAPAGPTADAWASRGAGKQPEGPCGEYRGDLAVPAAARRADDTEGRAARKERFRAGPSA